MNNYYELLSVNQWFSYLFLRSSRGLRHGDLLSPYLFVIVMEVLYCLIKKVLRRGYLSGWTVS